MCRCHRFRIRRKLKEVVLAARLEQEFSKDQIFELYLNKVYFGDGLYGVKAASLGYFGKHAADVDLPEAALIAGLVKAPSAYAVAVKGQPRLNDGLRRGEAYKPFVYAAAPEQRFSPADGCANAIYTEYFVRGTEPDDYCPLHGGGFWNAIVQGLTPDDHPAPAPDKERGFWSKVFGRGNDSANPREKEP